MCFSKPFLFSDYPHPEGRKLSGKTTSFQHAAPRTDQCQCPIIIQALAPAFRTPIASLRWFLRRCFFFLWQCQIQSEPDDFIFHMLIDALLAENVT
jgi:hypothetical protein